MTHISRFKDHFNGTRIETVQGWHQERHRGHWNRTESPDNGPYFDGQSTLAEVTKII